MKRLGNQIAVVTGMSSGKGRAIMLALAESGAKLPLSPYLHVGPVDIPAAAVAVPAPMDAAVELGGVVLDPPVDRGVVHRLESLSTKRGTIGRLFQVLVA